MNAWPNYREFVDEITPMLRAGSVATATALAFRYIGASNNFSTGIFVGVGLSSIIGPEDEFLGVGSPGSQLILGVSAILSIGAGQMTHESVGEGHFTEVIGGLIVGAILVGLVSGERNLARNTAFALFAMMNLPHVT